MTIFIVFNRYNRDSFNNNVADIPGHFGRPAMSARFKVYHRSDHFVVMLCYLNTSSLRYILLSLEEEIKESINQSILVTFITFVQCLSNISLCILKNNVIRGEKVALHQKVQVCKDQELFETV